MQTHNIQHVLDGYVDLIQGQLLVVPVRSKMKASPLVF